MEYQPSSGGAVFGQHQPQQGGYFGEAGGGPGSPNHMMLQMGLTYGQTILNQGLQRGEQSLTSSYLPIVAKLQRYFCVDNTYVRRKLGILLFPMLRKFPAAPPPASDGSAGGLDDQGAYPSSYYGSPTVEYPASSGVTAAASKHTGLSSLPTHDCFAFDLYIPLMSSITYIILSAFLYGLVHKGSVKADYLLSTTSLMAVWFVVEIAALKVAAYTSRVVLWAAMLDVVSLCGYKYVPICLVVLLRQLSGMTSTKLYAPAVAYAVATHGIFTFRSVTWFATRKDGRVPRNTYIVVGISLAVQSIAIVWFCFRPFHQLSLLFFL